jgi:hypothetical protein
MQRAENESLERVDGRTEVSRRKTAVERGIHTGTTKKAPLLPTMLF